MSNQAPEPQPDAVIEPEGQDGAPPQRPQEDRSKLTPEQRADAETVDARKNAEFYCPGCGRSFAFPAECRGASDAAPHPPIQTVATDELHGDNPDAHTPAPSTEITPPGR